MSSLKWAALGVAGAALAAMAGGCAGDTRTSNQGGGTLLSASSKLMAGKIGALTADEWQILWEDVPNAAARFNFNLANITTATLTDEQAQAIVDFLDAHNLNTVDELRNAINSHEITEADIPPELLDLIPLSSQPAAS